MEISKLRKIGLDKLWVVTVIVGIFVFVNTQPIRPNDFWWHIAIGREIATTGNIPSADEYSFTMRGEPYPSYQMFWLADVSQYGLYESGGPALVILVQSLMITAAYGLLLWLCWKISNSWRIAAVGTLFAVSLGLENWNVRPQTISFLLGVLYLFAIHSYRERNQLRWLAVFPLGMLVWVNSHGSFLIGLVLIGIWLGDEVWQLGIARIRKNEIPSLKNFWAALIALAMTLLTCLINPRGLGIISYVQALTSDPSVQGLVPEWAPPTFNDVYGSIFLIGLMLCASILAVSPKRPSFYHLVLFLTFGILGLKTTRGLIWFGIVMAPVLADHITALTKSIGRKRVQKSKASGTRLANQLILIFLVIIAVISLPWFKSYLPFPNRKVGLISSETPIQATEFLLSERPPGQLFHEMGFGSYLIWAAHPEYKVFADPRIELYPRDIWWDYIALVNALPGWDELLGEYDIHTIMLRPQGQEPFVDALQESSGWREIYKDQSAIIFVRAEKN